MGQVLAASSGTPLVPPLEVPKSTKDDVPAQQTPSNTDSSLTTTNLPSRLEYPGNVEELHKKYKGKLNPEFIFTTFVLFLSDFIIQLSSTRVMWFFGGQNLSIFPRDWQKMLKIMFVNNFGASRCPNFLLAFIFLGSSIFELQQIFERKVKDGFLDHLDLETFWTEKMIFLGVCIFDWLRFLFGYRCVSNEFRRSQNSAK